MIVGTWVSPRHGRGPQDQVTTLAKRGTNMRYANKLSVKLMYWFYIYYDQINPGYLMTLQDAMQAAYQIKDPIEVIFTYILKRANNL